MRYAFAALLLAAVLAGCGGAHGSAPRVATTKPSVPTGGASSKAAYVAPISVIQLAPSLAKYTEYVDQLVTRLRTQVATLRDATRAGDTASAELDWTKAHFTYLALGQDDDSYGAFGDLGEQIDGLAAGLPGTVDNSGFTGFHKVELDLWRRHDVTAATTDAARLASLVGKLTPRVVQSDLPLTAAGVDAWVLRCHEILEDGLRDSLTQDDDYGSNSDLTSLAADVTATDEMLDVLRPQIQARRPQIVPYATADLRTLVQAIDKAGGPGRHRNLRTMPLRERQALDEATGAATETLAPVSEILQVAVSGS